jgi:hypothetical protein
VYSSLTNTASMPSSDVPDIIPKTFIAGNFTRTPLLPLYQKLFALKVDESLPLHFVFQRLAAKHVLLAREVT